ncbi:MAG: polysaccharide biosynthesis/export family protein [Pseudomonadota bacterium]
MRKPVLAALLSLLLSAGCGVVYQSPSVNSLVESDTKLRVQRITPESTLVANSSAYAPKTLPRVFFTSSGATATTPETESLPRPIGGPGGSGTSAASGLELRVPPEVPLAPYRIGVGDVLLLATPQTGSTVEELTGLLAASNSRQGYTAQDDGAIAIPNVGRVRVVGLTLEEAENLLFQRLVENKIDPTFSLEVAEFNSQSISIGGAVSNPTVVPIGLRPVTIDQALAAAGGVAAGDLETASVRIYREGVLYQIPLETLYSDRGLQRTRLIDGDSLFIDTRFELDQAQAFFQQEIRAAEFDQRARINALDALQTQFDIRRAGLQEARQFPDPARSGGRETRLCLSGGGSAQPGPLRPALWPDRKPRGCDLQQRGHSHGDRQRGADLRAALCTRSA